MNGYGIRRRKPEFLFAGKRAARGDSGAQRLTGEVEFQMFAGPGENLLPDRGAEVHRVGGGGAIRR